MKFILNDHGFKVLEANNGAEALHILTNTSERAEVDVVVTDINMPCMDGIELVKIITQRPIDFGIIVMTAFGNRETILRLKEMGICNVIHKPFEAHHLISLIQATLDEQKKMNQ